MDTLAHALYGVTFFSRIGFSGCFKFIGSVKRGNIDWTIFAAAGFAVLPDLASIGIYFLDLILNSQSPTFHHLPRYVIDLYNATHSLLVAVLVCLILRLTWKGLFIPSLAWVLHVALDIVMHGHGRFQTPFLYPLSNYTFDGLDWWRTPWVIAAYWGALPLLWALLYFHRRRPI